MDGYLLARFGHLIGLILLGGGLAAVFVSELRAYGASDKAVFAEAARYTALFYDALVVPGAILLAITGYLLVGHLGIGFLEAPWLVGMWVGFLFEFVEGNSLTRIQFRRTLRISQAAAGHLDAALHREARPFVARLAHFLDLPMVAAIVWCGTLRPESWTEVGAAYALAVLAGLALTFLVPRLMRTGTA